MQKRAAFILLFSLCCTLATLFAPRVARTEEELSAFQSGWPFSYITQNLTAVEYELPHRIIAASPWENPTDFDAKNFIASLVFFAAIATGASLAHERITKRR